MTTNRYNVLFLCTGNSARSIMAEAILNHKGSGMFHAYSAGSHPTGKVRPEALWQLASAGISIEGLRSKSWDEFARPDAPALHFVFTVCDNAANEACPYWPGQPMTAHWGVPDPAAAVGTEAEVHLAFADALRMLANRINIFVSLPLRSLDQLTLQKQLDAIGRTKDAGADPRSAGGCSRRHWEPRSWLRPSSAPASWRRASRAETRRSRCWAIRFQRAPS